MTVNQYAKIVNILYSIEINQLYHQFPLIIILQERKTETFIATRCYKISAPKKFQELPTENTLHPSF